MRAAAVVLFALGLLLVAHVEAAPLSTRRVYLSFVVAGIPSTPTAAPTPTVTPPACCSVSAWMSDPTPTQYETETVTGQLVDSQGHGIAGATMHADWYYRTVTSSCDGTLTATNGQSSCSREIGAATLGYTVEVDVTMSYGGQSYTTSTSFTPK